MTAENWIQLAATLLGGGAAGAVITLAVNHQRAKRPVVGFRTEQVPVFQGGTLGDSDVKAKLVLSSLSGGHGFDIPNLFIVKLELINRGSRDFPKLPMGITLTGGDAVVHIASKSSDRHHAVNVVNPPGPAMPLSAVDFELVPFNRGDSYQLNLYIVVPQQTGEPQQIECSSPEPVVFSELPSVGQAAGQALEVALPILKIGRF